ncbi:hypothetical protein [Salinibacter phage M8CRM-1]|uniref:Uncharacterized protein n=1 Tax=Salinibacter phage M8CRM-1 TaxID=2681612 RepID=A0A2I6UGQ0_9CAUD|nr:hypothetical protein FGG67_gp41 [Salinibacter phage M8CRM-1]AUO79131.1 hypothetical protein [Salinibacter phage M8CRM-1]
MNLHKEFVDSMVAVFDPGVKTGAGIFVVRTSERLRIIDSFTMEEFKAIEGYKPERDYVGLASDRLVNWCRGVDNPFENVQGAFFMPKEVLIEFPSAAYLARGNSTTMIQVCRNAAEIGTAIAGATSQEVVYFGANDLRRSGRIVPNDSRPTIFRRIYGDTEGVDEHVQDAGLIAAKHLRVF